MAEGDGAGVADDVGADAVVGVGGAVAGDGFGPGVVGGGGGGPVLEGAVGPAGVVGVGELVELGLQFGEGGGGRAGGEPFLQGLLESFDLALGLAVVRAAVFLGDAQGAQFVLEAVAAAAAAGEPGGVDQAVIGQGGGRDPVPGAGGRRTIVRYSSWRYQSGSPSEAPDRRLPARTRRIGLPVSAGMRTGVRSGWRIGIRIAFQPRAACRAVCPGRASWFFRTGRAEILAASRWSRYRPRGLPGPLSVRRNSGGVATIRPRIDQPRRSSTTSKGGCALRRPRCHSRYTTTCDTLGGLERVRVADLGVCRFSVRNCALARARSRALAVGEGPAAQRRRIPRSASAVGPAPASCRDLARICCRAATCCSNA